MARKEKPKMESKNQKSLIKGLGLMGFGQNGLPSVIDLKDKKIVRIRPLHFDWKYDQNEFNPWKMEVRGQAFEPGMKTMPFPYLLARLKTNL